MVFNQEKSGEITFFQHYFAHFLHFSNTISPIFDIFPTLQEVILAVFQLFGEDFVGETVGRKGLWMTLILKRKKVCG